MSEETKASEKQRALMKKLGIEFHPDCSMAYAREVITAKIEAHDKEKANEFFKEYPEFKEETTNPVRYGTWGDGMPTHKEHYQPAVEEKPKAKEYHLTDEAIRSNALRCAIEFYKSMGNDWSTVEAIDLAKKFEEYIRNGTH